MNYHSSLVPASIPKRRPKESKELILHSRVFCDSEEDVVITAYLLDEKEYIGLLDKIL